MYIFLTVQIVPALVIWSSFRLLPVSLWHASMLFSLSTSLFPATTRPSQLILYFPCSIPRINHFSKEPDSFYWRIVFRKTDLGAWCAPASRPRGFLLTHKWERLMVVRDEIWAVDRFLLYWSQPWAKQWLTFWLLLENILNPTDQLVGRESECRWTRGCQNLKEIEDRAGG